MTVRILNAALDEDDAGEIIIRGTIDQASLRYINFGWYQRERGFSNAHTNEIVAGLLLGSRKLPDITVGMRGQRVQTEGNTFELMDKCFCIDGGQRLYAAAIVLKERPDIKIHLGAKVYLGTDEVKENEMFCKLGTSQTRVSPSVLFRNQKKTSDGARILVALNADEAFALKDRVAWGQARTRRDLINGFSLARMVGQLHAHKGGALQATKLNDLIGGLDALVATIGEDNLRTNAIRFFDVIDRCYGIRQLAGGADEPRPHMRGEFLKTLASLFSRYAEFWDGKARNEFYCPEKYIKRLKGFKLADYQASIRSSRARADVLYEVLRKRLNLGPTLEDVNVAAE